MVWYGVIHKRNARCVLRDVVTTKQPNNYLLSPKLRHVVCLARKLTSYADV